MTKEIAALLVSDECCAQGIRVFYALDRRYRACDYETWRRYIALVQEAAWSGKAFEYATYIVEKWKPLVVLVK